MNLFKLSWRNLIASPWSTTLNLILFSFGISIISLLLTVSDQIKTTLEKNQANISLVVGAKGSPLQLILSSIYHIDTPTGNIALEELQRLEKHPLISSVIPLSIGDNFEGFRIVGTDTRYPALFEATLRQGTLWKSPMEVVLGSTVAKKLHLAIGDEFQGAHGTEEDGALHEEQAFKVVGILTYSGTVVDQLILTDKASIWHLHEEEHHTHNEKHSHEENTKEVTAGLVQYKSPMAGIMLPRAINKNTNMQAASPTYETARLLELLGVGFGAIKTLAVIIIVISGLSIFISLYNSLKERKYEIAYLRVLGAKKQTLFGLILLEGIIVALIGYILGITLSHLGMYILGFYLEEAWKFNFSTFYLMKEEFILLGIALAVGIGAALLPAWQAYRIDISTTLSE
ncbi:ABC transporter permease [Algivirga pacifica]|uniref:ABC transporter permease n=1 Tax=Algivirga pacifica TaxID=1162670 RepID=A0ABP9DM04_9BACT